MGRSYKASRYNIEVSDPSTGRTVLFNSLYGSRTILSADELDVVRKVLRDPNCVTDAQSVLWDGLARQKHLVEDGTDELALVKKRKRAGMEDLNRLDVIVMPTLDCNFACTYCYESHPPSVMSDATDRSLRLWLESEIPRHKVVLLSWFGGEPLMAYRRVLSLTRYTVETAARSRVGCVTHMTTNGYLLDEAKSRELIAAGLRDFQITIDGPKETHDRFRPSRNGSGTFDRVHRNVVDLVRADPKVGVSLRVNFNHENLRTIPALLETFPGPLRPQLRIVFEPIFGGKCVSATENLPGSEISSALAEYYALASELGYSVVHGTSAVSPGRLVYCYAERESQVVVNFNGDVFKCSVADFSTEPRFGFLRDGVLVKEDRWDEWLNGLPPFDAQCEACVHLPDCMGGCRRERLCQRGTGSFCSLVPTNTSYMLKQLAFGGFHDLVREDTVGKQ